METPAACDKNGLKKGPWTPEEDQKLKDYIQKNGYGNWTTLPKNAGLQRCAKSCRLRWTNYQKGRFSFEEEEAKIQKSEKKLNASPPCHAIMKYLIPLLIALLALKYIGKAVSPFETHPANMWVFLIVILIYCLALVLLKGMQSLKKLLDNFLLYIDVCHSNQTIDSKTYSRILGYVVVISGAFSSVSLVSIFLPRLIGRILFWAFLPIILAGVLFFTIRKRRTRPLQENHDEENQGKEVVDAHRGNIVPPSSSNVFDGLNSCVENEVNPVCEDHHSVPIVEENSHSKQNEDPTEGTSKEEKEIEEDKDNLNELAL